MVNRSRSWLPSSPFVHSSDHLLAIHAYSLRLIALVALASSWVPAPARAQNTRQSRSGWWLAVAKLLLVALSVASRTAAQVTINVNTTQQGVTNGQCSLQEAIYSSEFGTNIALSQTDPDTTYQTGCLPGTGNGDTIVLPANSVFSFDHYWDGDGHNYTGPTATPIIFTSLTIEGNGATLQWTGSGNSRLFAVGVIPNTGPLTFNLNSKTYSGFGDLTLENVHIKNFHVKGGDGGNAGGGGGLGAGGAIYVAGDGTLTIENSTFDGNGAVGGNGDGDCCIGGGGGGLSGNGGNGIAAGGGGGGARGNGGNGSGWPGPDEFPGGAGGGGGTVYSGGDGNSGNNGVGGSSGYLCGGNGGDAGNDGHTGKCSGGGGGGGGFSDSCLLHCDGNGLTGAYGGGGGAGGFADGGSGGFGGGGGAGTGAFEANGGNGGFGGGGGAAYCGATISVNSGKGGPFGGNAAPSCSNGGGGGALGGAIFGEDAIITIKNSTFTKNYVTRGVGGSYGTPAAAGNGADAGAAVFAVNGVLTVLSSTIANNQGTGSSAGLTFYTFDSCGGNTCVAEIFCNHDGLCINSSTNYFTLDNTIIANNGARECSVLGNPDDNISLTVAGAGNLITQNDSSGPCPMVVSTSDPSLQPLQLNSPGNTPTMAILANSSAVDTGDTGTGIAKGIYADQRGVGRPQMGGYDIGAYEARAADFSFAVVPALALGVGGSVSVTVSVNSFEYFSAPVTLSAPTPPAGVSVSFSPSQVAPSANGSASSTMTISLAPTVTPGSYTPTISGFAAKTDTSAALTHSLSPTVVVSVTTGSISTVIGDFARGGSIDNSGLAPALNDKLSTAQAYVKIGDKADAISTLSAMINQLNAQSGKHITAPAAAVLITDTQALQSSLTH